MTISVSPPSGSKGIASNEPILFFVTGVLIDSSSVSIRICGIEVVTGGVPLTGYSVSFNYTDSTHTVVTLTHPVFDKETVDGIFVVGAYGFGLDPWGTSGWGGTSGTFETLSFSYGVTLPRVTELRAVSDCGGKAISLSWTNQVGITSLFIIRSMHSYCDYITDPGDVVYSGTPVSTLADTGLEPGRFYYYTIFSSSSDITGPIVYQTSDDQIVQGLSLRDYSAEFGTYVYDLLPKGMRQKDADPNLGTSQYSLQRFCDVIQCGVNLYRGWMESLLLFRDPDLMPLGRLGETGNPYGLISAHVVDLGVSTERSFDAGVLRRIAAGIIPVLQGKGTCTSLVQLTKIFTGWDATCDSLADPLCGLTRVFSLWNGESYILRIEGEASSLTQSVYNPIIDLRDGEVIVLEGRITDSSGGSLVEPYLTEHPAAGILDSFGDYTCITSAIAKEDPSREFMAINGYLRAEIIGTYSSGTFTPSLDSNPWQFPSPLPHTLYGSNAFEGMKIMDHGGVIGAITASAPSTTTGDVVLTVTGSIADGDASIAVDFTSGAIFSERVPITVLKFVVGEVSFLYNPLADPRLLLTTSIAPWSLLTSSNSPVSGGSDLDDVIILVTGAHIDLGKVTAVGAATLECSTASWSTDEFVGAYANPNWDQTRLYRVVANDATTLYLDVTGKPAPSFVANAGSTYVLLTESNAVKYSRLLQVLPSFLAYGARGHIKFEE